MELASQSLYFSTRLILCHIFLYSYHSRFRMDSFKINVVSYISSYLIIAELEWILSETGAVQTTLEKKPEGKQRNTFTVLSGNNANQDSSDDDDY